jgi:hypothetical protein
VPHPMWVRSGRGGVWPFSMSADVADPLVVGHRTLPAPERARARDAAPVDADLVDAHRMAAGADRRLHLDRRLCGHWKVKRPPAGLVVERA